jgi:hypothetical protein
MGKSNKRDKDFGRRRYVGDKIAVPVKYYGRGAGHGNYLAGKVDGDLVRDSTGRPLPWREVGVLK